MSEQTFGVVIQYKLNAENNPTDVRKWLQKTLEDKVLRNRGFTVSTMGSTTYGIIQLCVLIVENEQEISLDQMKSYLALPLDTFKIVSIDKR